MLDFKPSIEPVESVLDEFFKVSLEVCNNPSSLKVLESPLLTITANLCQKIEDGALEDMPKDNIYDLLRYYNLCNRILSTKRMIESGLTDLYRKANGITQRMSADNPVSFENKLKSKLSKKELSLLSSFQENMCSDIGEIDPTILNTCVSEMVEYSYSIYYMYHHFLFCMLERINANVFIPKEVELRNMLVASYRQYALECKDDENERLEEEAAKLKDYPHKKLSPEEWGKLYEQEQEAIDMIIAYYPGNEIKGLGSYYTADNIYYYSYFNGVIDLFTKGRRNEKLFSFKKLFDNKWEVFSKLTKDDNSIDVFFEFILRYDIIMCNMFPELEADFNKFLMGSENDSETNGSSTCTTVLHSDADIVPFVIRSEQSAEVIAYIKELMANKANPRDILKPLRAAQDAGVIRKPTWDEYCNAFPEFEIKSKSSLTSYTNLENQPYKDDESFKKMVKDFQERFLQK